MKRYPFVVVYRELPTEIRVLAWPRQSDGPATGAVDGRCSPTTITPRSDQLRISDHGERRKRRKPNAENGPWRTPKTGKPNAENGDGERPRTVVRPVPDLQ
jgi:hypothetical protein